MVGLAQNLVSLLPSLPPRLAQVFFPLLILGRVIVGRIGLQTENSNNAILFDFSDTVNSCITNLRTADDQIFAALPVFLQILSGDNLVKTIIHRRN
jgi:hypothetical protein